jgi:SnoaL-like domain
MKSLSSWLTLTMLAVCASSSAAESTTAQLQAIGDRQAIEQLLTGDYPRALDQRRWADYAALFTSDGKLTFAGRTLEGPAAIEKFFLTSQPPAAGPPPKPGEIRTMHIVSNLSFKIDGDSAVGSAYWQTIGLSDGHPAVLSAGHYEDVLKKVGGQWKFAKRVIASDLARPPASSSGSAPPPAGSAPARN